MINKSACMCM